MRLFIALQFEDLILDALAMYVKQLRRELAARGIPFPSSVYAQVEPWESEEERMAKRVMAYADKLSVKDNQ